MCKILRFIFLFAFTGNSLILNAQGNAYLVKRGQETGTFKGGNFIGWGAKLTCSGTAIITGGTDTATKVLWTNLTGITRSGDTLTKTAGNGWGNAGALSYNQVRKLENGWVDYKVTSLYNMIAFGFSCKNRDAGLDSIEYAVVVDSGQVQVYNMGTLIGTYGAAAVNDTIRIEKLGDILFYSKNRVIFYNQQVNPKHPLFIDIAIYTSGASLALSTSITTTKTSSANTFIINAGADQTVCASTPVRLGGVPTASGGTAPYTYSWSPSTALSSTTLANPTASTGSAITYVVTVADSRGTTKTDTVTISVYAPPVADAGDPQILCNGSSVTIGGSPTGSGGTSPYRYLWTPADSLNYDTLANPTANPSLTTLYMVTVMDTNNCYSTSNVTITVKPAIAGFSGNDTSIYKRDSIYIGGNPTAYFGTAPYTYGWSSSTGLNDDSVSNPRAYPSVTTSYILTVTDAGGCESFIDTVVVTVDTMPYVNAGADVVICHGDSVSIGGSPTAKGGTLPLVYSWDPSTGLSNAGIANPKASPDTTTIYVVTVTDDDDHSRTDTVVVTVNTLPVAYAGSDTSTYSGRMVLGPDTVATGGVLPYSYNWTSTAVITTADVANPFVALTDTSTFYLAVTDSNGCVARDTLTVTFDDIFGSSCNLDSCTWTVLDADTTNYTVGSGQKLCIRKTGNATGHITLNTGGSICVSGTMEPASFTFNGGTLTNNATGTVNLASSFTLTDSTQLVNDGIFQVSGYLFADTASTLINTGNIIVSGEVNVKTFTFSNYGVITLNATDFIILNPALVNNYGTLRGIDSLQNYDTLSLGNDGLVFAANYFNYSSGVTKKITPASSSTGGIVVCSATSNDGLITDSVDICDKTPSAGPVYLDANTGTVDGSVTYCQRSLTAIDSAEVCGSCPTLTLQSNGCEGDLIIFTASSAKVFDNYEFFRNDTSMQSSADASYTLSQPAHLGDVYKVQGTSFRSPCKQLLSDTLVIHAKPDVSIEGDSIAVSDSVTLTASGADTYIWYTLDGTPIDTAASITVFPSLTTTYVASGTNSNACTDTAHHQVQRPLRITYTLQTPTNSQPFSGSIDVVMEGGKAPFTFEWNTGSTEEGLKNIPLGVYHVSVTDADGQNDERDITLGTGVTWTTTTGVAVTTTSVTRTVPGSSWDTAGSVSADVITANTDGWAEFKVGDIHDTVVVGLGTGDNHGGYTDIDYAVRIENGTAKVYEGGTYVTGIGSVVTGDVIRIDRVGTSVHYKINDDTKRSTSTDPTNTLVINTAIYNHDGVIPFIHGVFTGISYEYTHAFHLVDLENVCDGDLDRNYAHTIVYDESGTAISDGKVYYDYLGRSTQAQTRMISDNDVLASQTLYDVFGRVVLQTLPAPINQSDLCYKDQFITNTAGTNYSVNDYDLSNHSHFANAYYPGEVERPKAVGSSVQGGLGWYYSKNNFDEPYVPASSYPYTRLEYDNNNLGAVKRSVAAGEKLNMGSGHELQTFTMTSLNETDYLYGKNKGWIIEDYSDSDYDGQGTITPAAITAGSRVFKTISVDQNGQESVVFTDVQGKTLAAGLSGQVNGSNVNTWSLTTTVSGVYFLDVHLPQGCASSLVLTNPSYDTYNFLNLETGEYVKFNNSPNFNGTSPNLQPGYYRIIFKYGINSGRDGFVPVISIAQDVNYYNFSIYYYDKAGRAKLTVPPAGMDAYTPSTGTVPVHKMIASTNYNSIGTQPSSISPDAGVTMYLYAKDGRLRFSQNARQRASNVDPGLRKFTYINYDETGRVVETGEYDPNISGVSTPYYFDKLLPGLYDPIDNSPVSDILESTSVSGSSLDAGRCMQQNYVMYDVADTPPLSYEQHHLPGKVSKTWNAASTTWYSYDELGRMEWTVQSITDMPSGITATKTINYTYDFNGNVTEVAYQQEDSDEDFYHYYEYDADKRLKKVYTSTDAGTTKQEQAGYTYYKHGPLKRVELANRLQGVDYVYTINGWLKSINAPELNERDPGRDGYANGTQAGVGSDLFGMTLDYFAGDYIRPGTAIQTYDTPENYGLLIGGPPVTEISKNLYNGIIKGQRWKTAVPVGSSGLQYTGSQLMNAYLYDNKYQLTSSIFGTITAQGTLNPPASSNGSLNYQTIGYKGPTVDDGDDYKIYDLDYDANGNIQSLSRNGFAAHTGGLVMDQLSYNYNIVSGRLINNKLRNVSDAATNAEDYTSFGFVHGQGTDNYAYNEIGEQTGDANDNTYTTYDVYGRVTAIYEDAAHETLKVAFTYDDRGYRLYKTDGTSNTWYIRDAGGNPMSIYDQSTAMSPIEQKEVNLYGDKRLGIYNVPAGSYLYELMDHLGNVRSTFQADMQTSITTAFGQSGDDDYLFTYNPNIDNTTGNTAAPSVKLGPGSSYGAGLLDYPVTAGQVISGSIYYKTSAATIPDAMMVFSLTDATTNALLDWTPAVIAIGSSTGWTQLNFSYTVPLDGLLRVYPWNHDPSQTVWFDDLTLSFSGTGAGIAVAEPVSITDYYAHGSIMPGHNYVGTAYRYGYQGQFAEKDDETNENSFILRNYNGLLGRWMTRDPARQYHSPYLAMGNNHVNKFDPDGGDDFNFYTYSATRTMNIGNGESINLNLGYASWYTITPTNTENTFNAYNYSSIDGNISMSNWSLTGVDAGNAIIKYGIDALPQYSTISDGGALASFKQQVYTDAGNIQNLAALARMDNFENNVNNFMIGLVVATISDGILAEISAGALPAELGGKNIVGTAYDAVKPTQDWINLAKVDEYKSLLQSGKTLDPIITYKNANGIFIEDGHHRFAAYMELGMEPNMILRNTGGPVGYPNWLNTTYQTPPLGH